MFELLRRRVLPWLVWLGVRRTSMGSSTKNGGAWIGLFVLAIGCYTEPQRPSTFRYACDSAADCNPNEICRRGLCEVPCSQLEEAAGGATDDDPSDDPCPQASGYAGCFNGVCSNTCAVGSSWCAKGQECIDLAALGIDVGGGSSDVPLGICGFRCEPGDDICPSSEVCLMGACVIDCSMGQVCLEGFDCVFGVCLPVEGLPSDEGGSSSNDSGSDGASTDPETDTGASDTGTT